MTGQIIKKVVQKLKRPEEKWYFNATPEMLQRFHFLLSLAPAYNYSQCKYFHALLFGRDRKSASWEDRTDREITWRKFQNEIELKFGRIDYDSCSTLATMDDNPGTGRLIDKFIYQPIGRSIERLVLDLELRYFQPPEKSACQIKRFIDGSVFFRSRFPISLLRFQEHIASSNDNLNETCASLLREISRKENLKIAKAFHRLLVQASSKNRSLRVEAQKQIWSLFKYPDMVLILNAITDLNSLILDGYTTTFQHCSPLDPDFQIHFNFISELIVWSDTELVGMSATPTMDILCISMRDILVNCARENRGFSSLSINLVIKLFGEELNTYTLTDHENQKLEGTKEFAGNLYLALIAIIGFCNEFPYALSSFGWQMVMLDDSSKHKLRIILPLWGRYRTESDINALELMVHFMINLSISFPHISSKAVEYYIALLNDADKGQGTMSSLEARASEDYLRKVTEVHVQRGPISFAMFKDMVTNPIIWERYHRPERDTEATDKSRMSTAWRYELNIYTDKSLKSSIPSFYYIPFSNSFGQCHLSEVLDYIQNGRTRIGFVGLVESWFMIQKWLRELEDNSVLFPCDTPGTELYEVMKWWYSYDIKKQMALIIQKARRPGNRAQPLPRSNGGTTVLPSPCQCGICKRFSHVPDTNKGGTLQPSIKDLSFPLRTEGVSSLHRHQRNPATRSSPLTSQSGLMKRKLEEEEPRPQMAPLPRRYRDNTAEDIEPGSSLGPVRKKQRTSFSLESDTSDADAIITEVDEDSTESDTGSEDAMSVNEDFWSAKSKLSLLAIED